MTKYSARTPRSRKAIPSRPVPAGPRRRGANAADSTSSPVKNPPFHVVGIGASAGGLDAFKKLFSAMPADSGMAFVLIPHLDPTHESLMAELLAKQTAMPVREAQDGMPVLANHVYVIPPNADLAIQHRVLRVVPPPPRRGSQTAIDFFLRSLAADFRRSGDWDHLVRDRQSRRARPRSHQGRGWPGAGADAGVGGACPDAAQRHRDRRGRLRADARADAEGAAATHVDPAGLAGGTDERGFEPDPAPAANPDEAQLSRVSHAHADAAHQAAHGASATSITSSATSSSCARIPTKSTRSARTSRSA